MQEKSRIIVAGLVALTLLIWLGFVVHVDTRFAGSAWGAVFAIAGSALMVVPGLYSIIKRVKPLQRLVTRVISMRTLLAVHIYAGVLGPILVLIHTGHKYNSPLGVALTALTLLAVLSGFIGRYLYSQLAQDMGAKKAMLGQLQTAYAAASAEIRASPKTHRPGFVRVVLASAFGFFFEGAGKRAAHPTTASRALRLVESISDVEYALKSEQLIRTSFSHWLRFHVLLSLALYALLCLHIWAGLHFGLRWWQ